MIYFVYGWDLSYFKGKIFNNLVPKTLKRKKMHEILDFYFDDDAISVFETSEGFIFGVFITSDIDQINPIEIQRTLIEYINRNITEITTPDFKMFLLFNKPRLVEAII